MNCYQHATCSHHRCRKGENERRKLKEMEKGEEQDSRLQDWLILNILLAHYVCLQVSENIIVGVYVLLQNFASQRRMKASTWLWVSLAWLPGGGGGLQFRKHLIHGLKRRAPVRAPWWSGIMELFGQRGSENLQPHTNAHVKGELLRNVPKWGNRCVKFAAKLNEKDEDLIVYLNWNYNSKCETTRVVFIH